MEKVKPDPRGEEAAARLPRVLVIVGPTASGKTRAAIRCALLLGAEIVSADSRQIYRRMDIGTAKPTAEERAVVPHHCIDLVEPDQPTSAGAYAVEARARIREILGRGGRAVVAGGSGLYIRALIDGIADIPQPDPELRRRLQERLATEGLEALAEELRAADPATAAVIDRKNPRRVLRALEVHRQSGVPLSTFHRQAPPEPEFAFIQAGLWWSRAALYRRIEARVDAMLAAGFLEETAALLRDGFGADCAPMRTVGYAEAIEHLAGRSTCAEMRERIARHTRNYAKRQETWFRADPRIRWFPVPEGGEPEGIADEIAAYFLSCS